MYRYFSLISVYFVLNILQISYTVKSVNITLPRSFDLSLPIPKLIIY